MQVLTSALRRVRTCGLLPPTPLLATSENVSTVPEGRIDAGSCSDDAPGPAFAR